MAHQRGGMSRQRCRRDGLFVDGVKVPTGPGGAEILWRDGSLVRRVTPASFKRIMQGRNGPLDVLVVAGGASVHPDWFDELPAGLAVWRGRLSADADAARSRRRVRQIGYWDDRNLLACVNFIVDHPDPAVPEQRLLATSALAAAESRQVAFVRRRASLEALVRAGERSATISADLAVLRVLQHGTPEHPLEPTEDRLVLRRRATRLLNRSEAAASRLQSAASLDRCGAALAVASRVAAIDERKALEAALVVVAAAAATNAAYLVSAPEAGLWAYRALATLSVFARANARTIERDTSPARAAQREARFERDHDLLARSAPDALLADAAAHGARAAAGYDGPPGQRVVAASGAATQYLADSVTVSAVATAELAQGRKLGTMLVNLAGAMSVVALHAKAAQLVAVANDDLSPAGVELSSAALLGASASLVGRSRHPGSRLAREAKSVRRSFDRSRASLTARQAEEKAFSIVAAPEPSPACAAGDGRAEFEKSAAGGSVR